MRLRTSALVIALAAGILAMAFAVETRAVEKVYRIGILATTQPPDSMMAAFRLGLREL